MRFHGYKLWTAAIAAVGASFALGVRVGAEWGVEEFGRMDSSAKASVLASELRVLRAGNGAKLIQSKEIELDGAVELTAIYVKRGLDTGLASSVATQLMAHDALAAHARDELGISDTLAAKPVQAALASAATFAVGSALPLVVALLLPASARLWGIAGGSLLALAILGLVAARLGGSPALVPVARVTFWGALAMATTAVVGSLFGVVA